MTREERFWQKVDKNGPGGCWLWCGGVYPGGYGRFWLGGPYIVAHRFAYQTLVGPIPEGLQLDHLCRVRHCVNPAHLEAVTCRVNVLRGVGLSAIEARITHCPMGHPYDELNTYRPKRGGRQCRACRRRQRREFRERNPNHQRLRVPA